MADDATTADEIFPCGYEGAQRRFPCEETVAGWYVISQARAEPESAAQSGLDKPMPLRETHAHMFGGQRVAPPAAH
jgi:hypothetical protein